MRTKETMVISIIAKGEDKSFNSLNTNLMYKMLPSKIYPIKIRLLNALI
jgi:hypothetical protein